MIYQFALRAAELAVNTRCENVVLLDMRGRSPVTEFFLIATGTSPRQMRTVADELAQMGHNLNFSPWQKSGYDSARWIVVDFVHVVVHIFDVESRDFYDLELLWGDAPRINWRAELGLPDEVFVKTPESAAELLAPSEEDDLRDAQEEELRLEGQPESPDDDADLLDEEDADGDASVVVELPDQEAAGGTVEFVEIDSPGTREGKGKARFPNPLHEAASDEPTRGQTLPEQSLDQDEAERALEKARDADPEATSQEDLPAANVSVRPMPGVSAGLSGAEFVEDNAEGQEEEGELEVSGKNREDVPPPPARSVSSKLTTPAAPGRVNPKKAKAGVVKPRPAAPRKAGKAVKATKPAKKTTVAKKAPKKAVAKKAAAKKVVAKKPAAKKAPAKKVIAKKTVAKKNAARKSPAPKKASKKVVLRKAPKKRAITKVAKKSPARKSAKKKR